MPEMRILEDMAASEQGVLARRAQIEFFLLLGNAAPTIVTAESGVRLTRTPTLVDFLNCAYLARAPLDANDTTLATIADFYSRNQCERYLLWIDDRVDRMLWDASLTARGYRFESGAPCMIYDTQRQTSNTARTHAATTDTLRIAQVNDSAGMEFFAHTAAQGFGFSDADSAGLVDLWAGLVVEGPLTCYIGFEGDVAVATAAILETEGVTGINVVSTLPGFRGKGYGAALTLHCCRAAQTRGYRYVNLTSSDMGRPVYERIGFAQEGFSDIYVPPHSS